MITVTKEDAEWDVFELAPINEASTAKPVQTEGKDQ